MVKGTLAMSIDARIVRSLNHWFARSSFRTDLAKHLASWPLYAVVALAVVAWFLDWGARPQRRAFLLLAVGGVVLALIGNQILGHFYYRPRPFVAMASVHRLLPHSKETSMYSDHLAVAGGLAAGIVATRQRWFGAAAVLACIALAVGRVGAGLHYPSDVLAGAAAGVVGFIVLLPARGLVTGVLRPVA